MIQPKTEGAIQFELALWFVTAIDTHRNRAVANSSPASKWDVTGTSSPWLDMGPKLTPGNDMNKKAKLN